MRYHALLFQLIAASSMQAQFAPPVPMTELRDVNTAILASELFDVDGDADQDLLLSTTAGLTLRFNEGNGTFGAFQRIHAQDVGGCDLTLGDLDGDGDPDLVQARDWLDSVLTWFANDGSGGFTLMHSFPYTDAARKVITLADMNGDGDMDIVCGAHTLRIYPNNGAGVFGTPQNLGNTLDHAFPADLDLDGDLDLVGIGESSDAVAFRIDTGSSYGSVTTPGPSLNYVDQTLAVDLDLDGDSDLVSMREDNIAMHMNLGGLMFSAQIPLAPGVSDLKVLRAADLTGDGAPELLGYTQSSKLLVFMNDGTGSFSGPSVHGDPLVSAYGRDLHIADVDANGDADAVTMDLFQTHWHRGAGEGTFLDERVLLPYLSNGASTGDMDGDGDLDLLLTTAWAEQTAPGTFTLLHTIAPRNNPQAAADLNGDGLMDTHTLHAMNAQQDSLIWCKNLGNGSFERIAFDEGDWTTAYMEAFDLDADSDLDLVRGGSVAGGSIIFDHRNDGSGNFTQMGNISSGSGATVRPAIADFDGDGDPDVACHEYQSPYFSVIENVGAPEMAGSPEHFVGSFFPERVGVAFPGDLDMDGDQDILLIHDEVLYWYANNGLGDPWTAHTVSAAIQGGLATCDLGDIDADGDLDVMYVTTMDSVVWRLNDGSGSFGPPITLAMPWGEYSVDLSDVDLDGDADLVLMASLSVWVFINQSIGLPTGMPHSQAVQPVLAPNPFSTEARLTLPTALEANDMVQLVDVNGQVLRTLSVGTGRSMVIARENLASGIYHLRIVHGGSTLGSVRFVVQ